MHVDHGDKRVKATVVFVGTGAESALERITAQLGETPASRRDRALTAEVAAPLAPVRGYELVAEVRAVDDLLATSEQERQALLERADGLACFGDRDRLLVKAACDAALPDDVPALLVPPGETALAVFKGMGHALFDRVRDELPAEASDARERFETLAGYELLLPSWWGEPTAMAHEHIVGFDSYGTRDFGLLVRIAPEAGGDDAVDAYLTATRQRWTAETRVDAEVVLANLPFRGESAYGCVDAHSVETLAGTVGPDLVAFHVVYVDKNPKHAQLRRLVLTMIETAIVRRWGRVPRR